MNFTFGKWFFCPRLLTSLLTALFVGVFLSLGNWQLNRADYKRTLHAEFKEKLAAPVINLNDINFEQTPESILWRRVKVSGRFIENKQILLDNQVMNGEPGYYIYTPLKLEEVNKWLLVNRGWLPAGNNRMSAPTLSKIDIDVYIGGVIKDTPKTGILLKDTGPEKITEEFIRVQKIEFAELEVVLNKKLLPYILRLDAEAEHGFVRNWQIPGSGEAVNKGYAFQWFAFAATLLIIYIILNVKKIEE